MSDSFIPIQAFNHANGERERIMARRRFVFDKRRDGYSIDEITDFWNKACVDENRPGEQVARATIGKDLQTGLKQLAEETKFDAEM